MIVELPVGSLCVCWLMSLQQAAADLLDQGGRPTVPTGAE